MTTTTTTLTQKQALCMFFGIEYASKNVKDCKEKALWAIMGYDSNIGSNWKKFEENCNEKDIKYGIVKAMWGETICRELYALFTEGRGKVLNEVLSALSKHLRTKQRPDRLDVMRAEAKSPLDKTAFPKSDTVKIGQEMKWMLNRLIWVEKPVVCGVLIIGFTMVTYKMELVEEGIYQMVQLGKTTLYSDLKGLILIPNIVSLLLQLKKAR